MHLKQKAVQEQNLISICRSKFLKILGIHTRMELVEKSDKYFKTTTIHIK